MRQSYQNLDVFIKPLSYFHRPPDGLHSQDLESALYYSFWVEVAAQRQMSRPAVKALQAHVNVLKKYLPANPRIIRFLKRVHHWLKSVNGNLTGTEWVANITNLQVCNMDYYTLYIYVCVNGHDAMCSMLWNYINCVLSFYYYYFNTNKLTACHSQRFFFICLS